MSSANFSRIEKAIAAIAAGRPVVVADSEKRENEGDLIFAAELATPELLAFTIRHTSGIICVSLPGDRLHELGLPLMVAENTESQRTAFTISVGLETRHHHRNLGGGSHRDDSRPGESLRARGRFPAARACLSSACP